jgi:hypothetical protein
MMTSPLSINGGFRDLAGRQHHPGDARPLEPFDELFQFPGAGSAVGGKGGYGLRVLVVDDGRMSMLHQPADDVAAHPSQADHTKLHVLDSLSLTQRFRDRGIKHLQSRF